MSLAIGLIASDSILFASETQTSSENVKSLDANKLGILTFSDSKTALVAHAGNLEWSARIMEIMEKIALTRKLDDWESVSSVIRDAVQQARNELRAVHFNCSPETLQEYIWKHDQECHVLTGHYFLDNPVLHHCALSQGVCTRVTSNSRTEFAPKRFAAIGTGADLASYLLTQFGDPGLEWEAGMALIFYVLEEVKGRDKYCGGDTHFVWMSQGNKMPQRMSQSMIDPVIEELKALKEPLKESLRIQLSAALSKSAKKWVASLPHITAP